MSIGIATFNAENLFTRPSVMRYANWRKGRAVLQDYATLSSLINADTYTAAIKAKLAALVSKYLYRKAPKRGRLMKLNEVRNKLVSRKGGKTRIVPNGRGDWVGFFELVGSDLSGVEVLNTGRVINAVRPDILCLVEVEDRPILGRFNDQVMQYEFEYPFRANMLIDGNDPGGIDIGCFSQFPIRLVRSHVDDARTDTPTPEPVFSRDCRDCPEFEIDLPGGKTLILLGNHLKSQGYGGKASNDAKRHAQAVRVAQIYRAALLRSPYVVVAGDLNAGPSDPSLAPLVHGTNLREVMTHPSYLSAPEPLLGTFDNGTSEKQKFDYILLSPALWSLVRQVRVERRGTWRGTTKAHSPEVKDESSQASDHSCVWVELNL
jgi:endonuclease/exonuclease/phosphatase family metal-dependent hydrolase